MVAVVTSQLYVAHTHRIRLLFSLPPAYPFSILGSMFYSWKRCLPSFSHHFSSAFSSFSWDFLSLCSRICIARYPMLFPRTPSSLSSYWSDRVVLLPSLLIERSSVPFNCALFKSCKHFFQFVQSLVSVRYALSSTHFKLLRDLFLHYFPLSLPSHATCLPHPRRSHALLSIEGLPLAWRLHQHIANVT